MYALPIIVFTPPNAKEFLQGSLLHLPPELSGNVYINQVLRREEGWKRDLHDYWSYAKHSPTGNIYIIPALIIEGESAPKKFGGYRQSFSKNNIEQYLENLIKREANYKEHAENDLNVLVHDLRHLSSAIYNTAEEAISILKSRPDNLIQEVRQRLDSIIASQTMLKLRTDVLDYEGAPDSAEIQKVRVYKKIDKVQRCFIPSAKQKMLSMEMRGRSYATCEGPDVFEIIPYTLIDNAIKYAPENSIISIHLHERGDEFVLGVQSEGPKILDSEKEKIFSKGYRGEYARKNEKSGSGLGLFLAKNLVENFNGTISVESVHRPESEYCTNIFTLVIPIHSRDIPPPQRRNSDRPSQSTKSNTQKEASVNQRRSPNKRRNKRYRSKTRHAAN